MARSLSVCVWLVVSSACGVVFGAAPLVRSDDALEARDVDAPPWAACERAMPWLHASEVPDSEARMVELAMTGGFGAWSREWIAAALDAAPPMDELLAEARRAGRPLLWYVPAVEGQHMILPHLLDRYMTVGPLSDPEVVALVERNFVPVKLPAGGELGERFGLVAPEVMQPALVVLTSSGRVLERIDRISTFQPDWLLARLADIAARRRETIAPPADRVRAERALRDDPADPAARRELARAWLDAGAASEAWAVLFPDAPRDADGLARPPSDGRWPVERLRRADDALLAARVALRLRAGAAAEACLARAASLDPRADDDPEHALLVGRRLQGQGDLAAARAAYERVVAVSVSGADSLAAEARWRAGACAWLLRDDAGARAHWRAVMAAAPDGVWAGKAAASVGVGSDGLPGESALVRGMQRLSWLDPRAYGPSPDSQWRRDVAAADELVRAGVAFLLEQQRADGSWLGPRWGGSDLSAAGDEERAQAAAESAATFHNIRSAISALACRALRQWRHVDPQAVDAALARGDAYLLRDDLVRRGDLTAWVYADAYRLLHYLDRRDDLEPATRARAEAAMAGWIDELVAQQRELAGPFRHYSAYTSTFVTANVTWCLHAAREAGLDVPAQVFELSADVLEGARGPDGFFGYLVEHPLVGRSRLGAGNRQALCEWVLRLCGRVDEAAVLAGVETFLESYDDSAELARKGNFHVPGLDNTAGYYVFHNLLPTCLAARELGAAGEAGARRLLELLCRLPEVDGTYIDSGFSYGKGYSTAAALLAFDALLGGGSGAR